MKQQAKLGAKRYTYAVFVLRHPSRKLLLYNCVCEEGEGERERERGREGEGKGDSQSSICAGRGLVIL